MTIDHPSEFGYKHEMTSGKKTLVIRLHRFTHRGQDQIGLDFPYNQVIRDHLQRFDQVRWTQTHRCFYIKNEPTQLRALVDHCRGLVWVVMTQLRSAGAAGVQRHPPDQVDLQGEKINAEVLSSIEKMRHWMEQKRYQPGTITTYIQFVTTFFALHPELAWDGLTREVITAYNHQHFIVNRRSYSTQNQWINAVKVYLHTHGLATGDLSDIERPRKVQRMPEVLSEEEVQVVFRSVANLKHKTLLMLIYSSGLRIGQTLALRVQDIRSDEGLIAIRHGKGKKDRRVPLSKTMLQVLRTYYDAYQPPDYLFQGSQGGPYSQSSARKILKETVAKAEIKRPITLHTLRHSYATHLTNRGVNIQYLQEILGHNSPKTTMLYIHLSGKDIRNIKSPLDDTCFNLTGISVLNKKENLYQPIKMYYQSDGLTRIEIDNPEYFHKTFDLNKIQKKEIELEHLEMENPDQKTAENILKSLSKEQIDLLELDYTFEIEFDEKLFYTILDMEDGNYVAVDKKGKVYRLNHDHAERVKLIADKPTDFFKIYKGQKSELEEIMNK